MVESEVWAHLIQLREFLRGEDTMGDLDDFRGAFDGFHVDANVASTDDETGNESATARQAEGQVGGRIDEGLAVLVGLKEPGFGCMGRAVREGCAGQEMRGEILATRGCEFEAAHAGAFVLGE